MILSLSDSVTTAYMIFGLSLAGQAIENPFDKGASQVELDQLCQILATEVDVICSARHQNTMQVHSPSQNGGVGWMYLKGNRPLAPVSKRDYVECVKGLGLAEIYEMMKLKVDTPEKVEGGKIFG